MINAKNIFRDQIVNKNKKTECLVKLTTKNIKMINFKGTMYR